MRKTLVWSFSLHVTCNIHVSNHNNGGDLSSKSHNLYHWYDVYMNITIPVIAVVIIVEEGTRVAVDGNVVGCLIAKRERD